MPGNIAIPAIGRLEWATRQPAFGPARNLLSQAQPRTRFLASLGMTKGKVMIGIVSGTVTPEGQTPN